PGLSGFQVRERSVLRDDRAFAKAPVEAVDQGGHDGLNEELFTVKVSGGQASRDKAFAAINPVILREAILGLPGEVWNPAALILNAAAKEGTREAGGRSWAEEVTSARQSGFSVAAGEVGEEVRAHEPADATAYGPLR